MISGLICSGKQQSQQLFYFPAEDEHVCIRKKKVSQKVAQATILMRAFCNPHSDFHMEKTDPPPPPPLLTQKKQNFAKMKKNPGDINILHKCTKNHDHILYCS